MPFEIFQKLFRSALLLGCAALASGCSGTDYVAEVDPVTSPTPSEAGAGDADTSVAPRPAAECAAKRIVVHRADANSERECPARLAAQTFGHALCACGDVVAARGLTTDAFDSLERTSGSAGAAIGANGSFTAAGGAEPSRIGGSFTLAGAPSQLTGEYVIAGDLRASAELALLGQLNVQRDAWLHGVTGAAQLIGGPGALVIERDLHLAADADLLGIGALVVGRQIVAHDFSVAPACACTPEALVDVAATIADAQDENLAFGIDAARFAALTSATDAALPCGHFRLDAIAAPRGLSLQIDGPVVLFVEGSVSGEVNVRFGPEGTLDLFVGGDLALATAAGLSPAEAPARLRIYAADDELPVGSRITGNVYAPNATLLSPVAVTISGALFAAQAVFGGEVAVHYDRAVLAGLDDCGAAAGDACAACNDCEAGLGCLAGTCAACTQDADCCAPLACVEGQCGPLAP